MPIPGDSPEKYYAQGVLNSEIGPMSMVGKGIDEVDVTMARLKGMGLGGCPFAMGKPT